MRNFILGTDWWTDCDDAIALRMLARAHKAGEIDLKGIVINACLDCSVQSVEGFLNTEGVGNIPLGIDREATDFGGNPPYQRMLSAYAEKYRSNDDAEDGVRLYRMLLVQSSEPLEIIEIGYLNTVAALLESSVDDISDKNGIELVKEKVKKLWVMAGKWDEENGRENNFCRNSRSRIAGEKFLRLCPVPVTLLGWEVGSTVLTAADLEKDDVLSKVISFYNSPNGRMSWDPMVVLMAFDGDEAKAGYNVKTGTASLNSETGENTFTEDPNGLHRYVIKARPDEYYRDRINELIK
ncbi:MAG: nucleoside hydrolase [Clostridia bacterium]|nr:nucleoside hydrolase [Clostridia bacterium]